MTFATDIHLFMTRDELWCARVTIEADKPGVLTMEWPMRIQALMNANEIIEDHILDTLLEAENERA